MWNVPPAVLCQKHLLGEHVEMHMFVGSINKGKSIAGFVADGLVDTGLIGQRHSELKAEMLARGMNHQSPLPAYNICAVHGEVDVEANLVELARRCPACAELQRRYYVRAA
jgi:hypothetical protein